MKLSCFLATLLPFLAEAKTQSVYSFAEGTSSPDGLKHGARGLDCIRKLHGTNMDFLKQVENHGEEVTEEHIAAAIFMAYGEKGIDNVCKFTSSWGNESTRRWLKEGPNVEREPAASLNSERRTQTCAGGADVPYPARSDNDPNGVYSGYVSQRLGSVMPDGAGSDSRLDPAKVVTEAQQPLDEALEGEYHSILCGTYFNGVAKLASIPDFVVFKQGPILDGINQLSCGIGERAMQAVQATIRSLLGDGMKHNSLINRAEMTATYENSKILADELCSMSTSINTMRKGMRDVKKRVVQQQRQAAREANP